MAEQSIPFEAEQLPENFMPQTNNPVDIPIMRRALSNVIRAVCQNPKKKCESCLPSKSIEIAGIGGIN